MNGPTPFTLHLGVFEGPLDLLLHLIEKEDLDITAVSLVQVTDQYLQYVHAAEQINLEALADFVAIGARLLFLKSRALLPRSQEPEPHRPEEPDDGEELARLLEEYRNYKAAAAAFRELETKGFRAFPRLAPPPEVPLPLGLDGVSLRLLVRIFQEALERKPAAEEPPAVIQREQVTVEQKAALITDVLSRQGRVSFRALVAECRTRVEIIVSFLAVLELIKALRLRAEQDELFGDILLLPLEAEAAS